MSDEKIPLKEEVVLVSEVAFSHDDIFRVVDAFYTRIQNDPILQIPFRSVHDWPEHVKRLTHFWWIRFGGAPYLFNFYNPVAKHYFAGFNRELLARWLDIFQSTLKSQLRQDQSDLWSLIAQRMGDALAIKNEMFGEEYESERK